MKTLMATKNVFENLRLAASLSPIMILAVIGAEGLQHVAEYSLGMYASQAIFHSLQNNPLRLGFGIFKAVIMIAAIYMIAKNIAAYKKTPSKHGSFRADMMRKLWDPTLGFSGLLTSLLLAAPIIFLHYKLSYMAMGHSLSPLILTLDSLLIGFLALVIGTAIWAGDEVDLGVSVTAVT